MILRTRILALAALLATLFLSLIVYTLVFFSTASAELNRIAGKSLAVEKTTETLNATILLIRSDIWDTMIFDRAHRPSTVEKLDARALAFYQGLRDLAAADPGFAKATDELRLLFQDYYLFGTTLLDLNSLDDFVREAALVQKFRQNQAELLTKLDETVTTSKDQFFGSMEKLNTDFAATTTTAFTLAGLVTLLSFAVAVLIAGRLARPLERLTRTVRQVSAGDYTVRPELTSSGEIRWLTETFVTMLDRIEDYSGRMEDLVRARTDALERTNAVMVKELKLAQKIQHALVPQAFPAAGSLSAAGAYLPMEDLGGDFYDVVERAPGQWVLVMADVSGHGVPAALVTAMVKISLGARGTQTASPSQTLQEVNRELCAAIGDLKRYVTMVLCHVDLNARTLSYCNAGHNELIVTRRSGGQELYGPNSGVVGLRSDELFFTRTIAFAPGDGLVLFTDGLVEARDRAKRDFGLDRVLALVATKSASGPAALVETLKDEVQHFAEETPRQDDIAVLAVRWEEKPTPAAVSAPELGQGDLETPTGRAEALYRANEFEALVAWTEARLVDASTVRERSRLQHWHAMGLHRRGADLEALEAWSRALEEDPDNQRARRNRDLLSEHLAEVKA